MSKLAIGTRTIPLGALVSHARTPLYRNAYALMLSTAATSGLGVVYWALAARLYPTEIVGLNSAVISTMVFLSGMAQLNLRVAMIRFIPTAGRATSRLVRYTYLISMAVAALVGIVFVLGLGLWAPALSLLHANLSYGVWFVLAVMLWGVFALQDNVLTGLRQTLWVPLENTIFAIAKIALLIIFVGVLRDFAIFAAWTLPVLFLILPVNYFIFRHFIPKHEKATEPRAESIQPAQIAKYVGGDYVGSLFALASASVLPIMVTNMIGPAANAYYYTAWLIASTLQMLNVNMGTSLTVEGAADQSKLLAYSHRFLIHGARLVVPMVTVLIIGAPIVLGIFGKNYADEGITLLRLLALSAIPHMVNALFISIARVQRRIRQIVLVQALDFALTISTSYILMQRFGITGIGFALLATETILAVVLLFTQILPLLRPHLSTVSHPAASPTE